MHIELLATFRGPTARKDMVDATNLVQGLVVGLFHPLCLFAGFPRGCSRLLEKSFDHSGYLPAVG